MTDYEGRHTHPDSGGGESAPRSRAESVQTVVVAERGQWAVDILVVMDDGVVRRRIGTYRSEALARISANYIKRGADRDIPGPING